jgi:hypothetical protein
MVNTRLSRESIGPQLLQEVTGDYLAARGVFVALKSNFASLGYYDEASWAYIRERQMEKMMNHPRHAQRYYSLEEGVSQGGIWRCGRVWRYYSRHTLKWIGDWLVDLICGYGESFLRVLATLAAVYILFTLGYGLTSSVLRVTAGPEGTAREFTGDPVDWAIFSLGALTTMDPAGLEARSNVVQLVAGVEALLGIFLTGLLGFVVANRIRRS